MVVSYGCSQGPSAAGYSIDDQFDKPILFVTDDEGDLGLDRPFWGGHGAQKTVGFVWGGGGFDRFFFAGRSGHGRGDGERVLGGGFARNGARLMPKR